MKNLVSVFLAMLFLLVVFTEKTSAIPAFARKYRMSCTTCHTPFPKLKPYGDEFAGNGFVLSDQEAPRYYVDTGDDELSLIRDFPIAIRLEGLISYNNNNSEKSDFNAPYNLKLLSGGAIAPHISYYFYFFLSERGEVAGIEDAFIMFNNVFNSELDIYVGQFQVSDPLFKRELRLTFQDYLLYENNVGMSHINLTYDRGLMFTYGFDSGTDLVLEILNGSGIGEADLLKNFDRDKYKNLFGRISQDIGEYFRLGAFGYWGKEALESENHLGQLYTFINDVWMAGPDFTINYNGQYEFNFEYIIRNDSQPLPSEQISDVKTKSMMAEFIYMPEAEMSNWYLVGLYNWQDSDLAGYKESVATGHVGYMLRRNIRLYTELTYDIEREFGQIGVGFVSAF